MRTFKFGVDIFRVSEFLIFPYEKYHYRTVVDHRADFRR